MTETTAAVPPTPAQRQDHCEVPKGFFEEISALLQTESASEIAEVVITVCTGRGILHPELEEHPDAQLRADELDEVFSLLAAVTDAVADGTIVPRRLRTTENLDSEMAAVWEAFVDAGADADAEDAVQTMLTEGKPSGIGGVS